MKVVAAVAAIGLAIGIAATAYGQYGPWYARVPLTLPISFSGHSTTSEEFSVGRTETYLIEAHFERVGDALALKTILGDFTHQGTLEIGWEILEGGKVLGAGSNVTYRQSTFSGVDEGVEIGTFDARRGAKYLLHVEPRNVEPKWDLFHPSVQVALHPAKLEYLLVCWLFGAGLSALSALVLVASLGPQVYRAIEKAIMTRGDTGI